MDWKIVKNGKVIVKGYPADVREKLEEMVEEKTGYFLSMQEEEEEGDLYLHSEFADELTEEEYRHIISMGFSEDPGGQTKKTIEDLLGIEIHFNS